MTQQENIKFVIYNIFLSWLNVYYPTWNILHLICQISCLIFSEILIQMLKPLIMILFSVPILFIITNNGKVSAW